MNYNFRLINSIELINLICHGALTFHGNNKGVSKINTDIKYWRHKGKPVNVASIPVIIYHFMTNCSAYPIYISKFTFYHAIPFSFYTYT